MRHTRYIGDWSSDVCSSDLVAPAWETEKALDEFGEGIHPGEPHTVALLDPGAALELSGPGAPFVDMRVLEGPGRTADRKSTRLNSSHRCISYAVFCLKKKNK